MAESSRPEQIDFIRLDGHAVRVTSWTRVEPAGFRLVTITRGSRDAELLGEMLRQPTISLELPDQAPVTVAAFELERRDFGEGQSAISRFSAILKEPDQASLAPEPGLEERVASLEAEVRSLRLLVEQLANAPE